MHIQPSSLAVSMTIRQDEDWYDSWPPLRTPAGAVLDLTGKRLHLYIGSTAGLITRVETTSADVRQGIVIDDAAAGLASMQMPRATVVSDIPVSDPRRPWTQYLVLQDLTRLIEIWRGALFVLPGRVTL